MDLAAIDLYTGVCEFLKIGSAASFLKKEHGVECIHGYSLPAGVSGQLSLDPFRIRMYDGNLLFMVTDGVLGALPVGEEEQILKDLIGNLPAGTPAEMAGTAAGASRGLWWGNRRYDGSGSGNLEAVTGKRIAFAGAFLYSDRGIWIQRT